MDFGVANDIASVGFETEIVGVAGGELKAIEQRCGAFGFKATCCERVDDLGESDLNRLAVFKRGELEYADPV